jgi:hypothetical protein
LHKDAFVSSPKPSSPTATNGQEASLRRHLKDDTLTAGTALIRRTVEISGFIENQAAHRIPTRLA